METKIQQQDGKFDSVAYFQKIKEQLSSEIADMNAEQLNNYLNVEIAKARAAKEVEK